MHGTAPPDVALRWFAYIPATSMILRNTSAGWRTLAARGLLDVAVMNKLLSLSLSLPLVACVVGADTPGGTNGNGSGAGSGDSAAAHISTNTMWSGTMSVPGQLTIDKNVTLTIAAGTNVTFAPGASIVVNGTLDVQGKKGSVVNLSPATAGGHHNGLSIPDGGELKMTYGVQVGGGIDVNGGKVTISDTLMSQSSGDFLVVGTGNVDVSYSAIGLEPGAGTDTTHCDMHFGAVGATIKVTHSNVSTSAYGIMLYGGTGVDLTYNNWFGNQIDVDTYPGAGGDVSYGWFAKGAPVAGSGATLIYTNPSATRLPAATVDPVKGTGPR